MLQIKNHASLISKILITLLLLTAAPYQIAYAKMITTGDATGMQRVATARAFMDGFMVRDDVRAELENMGIAPDEAAARVNNLSEAELVSLADTIQDSPAGASAVGAIVGAALLIFLVLLITDITGYTHVFNFTN